MDPMITSRSARRRCVGIDSHTDFVGTLVSELDSALASLQAAARRLAERPAAGEVELMDPSDLDRTAGNVRRLVRLLDAIDGPGEQRELQLVSLPEALARAAKGLELDVEVRGAAGDGRFVGDAESVRLGVELVLLALGGGQPVWAGIANDWLVVIQGTFDPSDDLGVWRLRSGRRVLEGENCRVRMTGRQGSYRVEIGAVQPPSERRSGPAAARRTAASGDRAGDGVRLRPPAHMA